MTLPIQTPTPGEQWSTAYIISKAAPHVRTVLALARKVFHGGYTLARHRILSFWVQTGKIMRLAAEYPVKLFGEDEVLRWLHCTIDGKDVEEWIGTADPIGTVEWTNQLAFLQQVQNFQRPVYENTNSAPPGAPPKYATITHQGVHNLWFVKSLTPRTPPPGCLFWFGGQCFQREEHYHYVFQLDIPVTPAHVSRLTGIPISMDLTPVRSTLLHCVRYLLPQIHWPSAQIVVDDRPQQDTGTPANLVDVLKRNLLHLPANSSDDYNESFPYLRRYVPSPRRMPGVLPTLRGGLVNYDFRVTNQTNDVSTWAAPYIHTYTLHVNQRRLDMGPPLDYDALWAYAQLTRSPRYALQPVFVLEVSRDLLLDGTADEWATSIVGMSQADGNVYSNVRVVIVKGEEQPEYN